MYHLVWVPKYRKRILKGRLVERLKELFCQCVEINRWEIHELKIQEDHVHILLQTKPRVSISKVAQLLKGGSSKVVRDEFPELEEFLWGDSFWADGYFVETVGKCSEEAIREYIRSQ